MAPAQRRWAGRWTPRPPWPTRPPWASRAVPTWPTSLSPFFAGASGLVQDLSGLWANEACGRALGSGGGVFPAPSLKTRKGGRRLKGASSGRPLLLVDIGAEIAPFDDFQQAAPARPSQQLSQDNRTPSSSTSSSVDPAAAYAVCISLCGHLAHCPARRLHPKLPF